MSGLLDRAGRRGKAQGRNKGRKAVTGQGRRLGDFEGTWHLDRVIDHGDGTRAVFAGMAMFRRDGDGLAYIEEGQLRIGTATPITARQSYRWDSGLIVRFPDGRLFHTVPEHGGAVHHFCDPDTYAGHYDFSRWPGFSVAWQVTGPRKDYRMVSRYRR